MTTQIKAIPMDFMHKLSSLLQRMPIFPNPPPKLAQKRDNRENQKKNRKNGEFRKDTCIHGYFMVFQFFFNLTKEIILEIAKNWSTYPHVINNK